MTVIRRVFDLETRTLKGKERCYIGQPNDHLSTRIEFDYNPINAITTMGYVPYIMFNIMNDWGQPIVYGPGSSSAFDGKSFEIPYEVMSRVKSSKLEYQLWLVRDNKEWSGDRYQLEANGAEYLHSGIDGFAVKGGIRCRGPSDPCRPVTPCVDPSLMQWLTFFQKQFIMAPVQESYGLLSDGVTQGVQIYFPKYIENEGKEIVELAVPFLEEDGKLDTDKYLTVHDTWPAEIGKQDLVTARLMYESLSYKTDKWMAIPEWDPTVRYEVGSTVMYKDGDFAPNVYLSKGYNNVGHNPVEEPEWWSTVTEQERVVVSWETVADDTIPSSKLVDDEFSLRAIREWKPYISYLVGSTVIFHNNIYISIRGNNLNEVPVVEDPNTGLSNLNDQYWSRVSGDVDVSEIPTSTEVFPLEYSIDLLSVHGEESEYRIVRRDDIPGYHVYDLHHPFNTRSLFVQVKRNTGNHEYVDCLVETPERNIVRLKFDPTLTSEYLATLEAIVSPGGGRDEAYVMEDFVNKEMLGDTVATLEDGFVPGSQINFGTITTTQTPSDDMVARFKDLVRVQDESKKRDVDLGSRINYLTDTKTEKSEFGPWNEKSNNYRANSVVSKDSKLYVCIEKPVTSGIDPAEDPEHWKAVKFEEPNQARASIRFGNPSEREYILPHSMDTKDFVPAIRRVRDGRYMMECEIFAVDFNTIRVVVPDTMEPEAMVLNLCGCPKESSTLPSVGVQTFMEESDTWSLENPTRKPLFVQAFDSDGQLQYANVLQDPASSYDPVTIELYKSTTGSAVYAPASRTIQFTKDDLVEVEGGYDLIIDKSDLLQAGETENKWYLVQGYMGTEGQFMADFIQDESKVSVGLSEQYVDNLPEGWEGSIVLVEGNVFSLDAQIRFEFTLPSGSTRPMGVQTYANGTGMVMGDAYCKEGTITIDYGEEISGFVVIL